MGCSSRGLTASPTGPSMWWVNSWTTTLSLRFTRWLTTTPSRQDGRRWCATDFAARQCERADHAQARVNYRHLRQSYLNNIFGPDHPAYPVVEIASRSRVINIGENQPTTPLPTDNQDWMRWNNLGIGLLDQLQYDGCDQRVRTGNQPATGIQRRVYQYWRDLH